MEASTNQTKSAMQFAETSLKKTRKAFRLGSSNINSFFYDYRLDKHVVMPGLLSESSSRNFEALAVLKPEEKINVLSNKRVAQIKFAPNPYHQEDPKKSFLQNILDSALVLQAGNCGELALYAAAILRQEGYTGKVELVKFDIDSLDHAFLIINRPENTSFDDWQSWGKETIIVDPWLNQCFRGDEFGKIWNEKIRKFSLNRPLTSDIDIHTHIPSGIKLLKVALIKENPLLEIDPNVKPQFKPIK